MPRRTWATRTVPGTRGDDPPGPGGRLVPGGRDDRRARISELLITEALDRVPAEQAGPGDIIAVAGLADITIGETLADPENPDSAARDHGRRTVHLDDDRHQHLADDRADRQEPTARLVKARLESELIGNVSLRVADTERPDTWEVQGRGELQLAILVEMMRREGFELTVGKPQVVTRDVDGARHEPVERLTVDVPEDYVGVVTQLLGLRKGRMDQMVNHGSGWVRMDYRVPARGLIGFRTEFLTETRGTGLLHHVFDGYEPWFGEVRTRPQRIPGRGPAGSGHSYACLNLQERGALFVAPGTEVYEGMIVGENSRADDMDVNPTKEKKLTNIRSSTGDELVRLIPPRPLSLEQALEFCREDECVEVTPAAVRLRKVTLDGTVRGRGAARRKRDG